MLLVLWADDKRDCKRSPIQKAASTKRIIQSKVLIVLLLRNHALEKQPRTLSFSFFFFFNQLMRINVEETGKNVSSPVWFSKSFQIFAIHQCQPMCLFLKGQKIHRARLLKCLLLFFCFQELMLVI